MLLSYSTLFSIQLLHEYYNKDIFTDCLLLPAADTKQVLGGNILCKFTGNKLFVLLRQDKEGKPYSPLNDVMVLRFYLKCNNPCFFNYSNLPVKLGKGTLIYCSNVTANVTGTDLNLTAPIADYDPDPANVIYQVGDFVMGQPGNDLYECIKKGNQPVTDDSSWILRAEGAAPKAFVSASDLVKLTATNFRYAFFDTGDQKIPIVQLEYSVKGFKVAGSNLEQYDALTDVQTFTKAVTDIAVDLSGLSYGRYNIILKATTEDSSILNKEVLVYYDPGTMQTGIIGVVEVFNHLPHTDDYGMLDIDGKIKDPGVNYTIRFANKLAIWKYISQTTRVSGIDPDPDTISFTQDNNVFTSDKPIGLKQLPDNVLMIVFNIGNPPDDIRAAYPSAALMKYEKDTDGDIKNYYTEIYLNY